MSQSNGYGTVVRHPPPAATNYDNDEEQQPLLNGNSSQRKSLVSRMRKAARAEVKRDWADVVLIFCYIITGLLDSASISIWGSFVSMQTGKLSLQSHPLTHSPPSSLLIDILKETRYTLVLAWQLLLSPPAGSNPAPHSSPFASAPSPSHASTAPSHPRAAPPSSPLSLSRPPSAPPPPPSSLSARAAHRSPPTPSRGTFCCRLRWWRSRRVDRP